MSINVRTWIVAFFLLLSGNAGYAQCNLTYNNYQLVFSEEFNYRPDFISDLSTRWMFAPSGPTGVINPSQAIPDHNMRYTENNLSYVAPGYLQLKVKRVAPYTVNHNGQPVDIRYEGGMIESKVSFDPLCSWGHKGFNYGMFEARIKMPPGFVFPAFWLTDHCTAEIDIIEDGDAVDDPKWSGNNVIHWKGCTTDDSSRSCQKYMNYGVDLSADFHKYTCVWTPKEVAFFFDDQLIRVVPSYVVPTAQCPASIYINNTVFKENNYLNIILPNGFESNMLIDYVRVYKPINNDYSKLYTSSTDYNHHNIPIEAQKYSEYSLNISSAPKSIAVNKGVSNVVYYRGLDNYLYTAQRSSQNEWLINKIIPLNGYPSLVGGEVMYSQTHNYLIYRGVDNSISYIDLTNNTSGVLTGATNKVSTASGAIAVSNDGNIIYRGTNNKLNRIYKNGTIWSHQAFDFGSGTEITGDLVVNSANNANDILFRGTDGRLKIYYRTGANSYGFGLVDQSTNPNDGRKIAQEGGSMIWSADLNGVVYVGEDAKIHIYRWGNSSTWEHTLIPIAYSNSRYYARSGIAYDEYNKQIYYVGNDGRLQNIYKDANGNWIHGDIDDDWTNDDSRFFNNNEGGFAGNPNVQIGIDNPTNSIFYINRENKLCYFKLEPCKSNYYFCKKPVKTLSKVIKLNEEGFSGVQNVEFYPNPTSGDTYIKGDNLKSVITIRIYDMLGNIITNLDNFKMTNGEIQLPTSKLSSGIYIVECQYLNGTTVKEKLIKS